MLKKPIKNTINKYTGLVLQDVILRYQATFLHRLKSFFSFSGCLLSVYRTRSEPFNHHRPKTNKYSWEWWITLTNTVLSTSRNLCVSRLHTVEGSKMWHNHRFHRSDSPLWDQRSSPAGEWDSWWEYKLLVGDGKKIVTVSTFYPHQCPFRTSPLSLDSPRTLVAKLFSSPSAFTSLWLMMEPALLICTQRIWFKQ